MGTAACRGCSALPQSVLRDCLLSVPSNADPLEVADFAEVASRLAVWPCRDHGEYFGTKIRQVILDFLCEARDVLQAIRTQPVDRRLQAGQTIISVRFVPGAKANEFQVDRSQGTDDTARRGLQKGDCVGVSADGNWNWAPGFMEAEVVNERPLVVKFWPRPPNRPVTQEPGAFRVDKLANRQQFTRIVQAIHTLAAPLPSGSGKPNKGGGNGPSWRERLRPSESVIEA